jgi:FKBP-type peptidyl-prolyl cis-trans isomerase SlyD
LKPAHEAGFIFQGGTIMSNQIISFNCVLRNKTGGLIRSTQKREVLNGATNREAVLEGLAKGLKNLTKGDKRWIVVLAEEAYGVYQTQKVILYPRRKLDRGTRVGETVAITGKSGQIRTYKILKLHNDMASLDGNHPLAGQDLIFEIEALATREATVDEVTQARNSLSTQILH